MLLDFFKLNCPFTELEEQSELTNHLRISIDIRDVQYLPDTLKLETTNAENPFVGKTFTNVSFSKTEISGVIFRNCVFIDCLFIATQFVNCEFHGCTFTGCNPFRVEFKNTYINPSVFEGMLDPVKYWNIGIYLFQQLYNTSTERNHLEFANAAEFNRRKWNRYVLNHNYPGWKKTDSNYIKDWLLNYLFYVLAGYGFRPKFLVAWAVTILALSVSVNFIFWDSLNVVGRDGPAGAREFIKVFYYTVTIPGGVGDFTPGSDVGRLIFMGEAFGGLIIASLFVAWLVRHAFR